MNQTTTVNGPSGLSEYAALLRRRWLIIAIIFPLALFVALAFAYGLSPLYRSSATLMLEQSAIQGDLITSTVASYADQQIEVVQGRVMDQTTLEQLISEQDLYPWTDWSAEEKARQILLNTTIERVDPVTLEPLKKSNAFSIHYMNPNPAMAEQGARAIAGLFLTYHQKVRSDAAQQATVMLTAQAASITEQLQKVDQQISDLKVRHGGVLPGDADRNENARQAAVRDLDTMGRDLRAAQERESLLQIQLSSLSPRMMTRSGDLTDLATVRAQLAEAQQKYTPDHPDVKRLQRALESLQAQGARDGGSGVKADNPEYLRVAGQLEAARRDASAIRESMERVRAQMFQYSGMLRAAPEVEREYAELERRRASLQTQYQDVQSKIGEARLGQMVEAEKRGERFAMVWPPVWPGSPSSPNRLGLTLLGVVLGLALSAIALAIAESADPSVRGLKDMGAAATWPLLGAVPPILTRSDRRAQVRKGAALLASYAVAVLIVVGLAWRTGGETAARIEALAEPPQAMNVEEGR